MPAPNFIPQTDPYSVPTGFSKTTTPGGGDAFLDQGGNMYTRNATGFQLYNAPEPTMLPGNQPNGGYVAPAVVSSSQAIPSVLNNQNMLQGYASAPAPTGVVTATSPNAAYQNIISDTNKFLEDYVKGGGTLTPDLKSAADSINGLTAQKNALVSKAQDAQNNGDYSSLDKYIQEIKDAQQKETDALTKYYADIAPLRTQYLESLKPSQQETDLQTQLTDIRKQAADYALSVREGQQAQFGLGRPLSLSTGRAEKIGQEAQNTITNYQNQERNLLDSLNIATSARQATSKGLETAMGFTQNDYEIQQKVNEQISANEDKVYNMALKLDDQARQNLSDILSSLQGVNPDNLDPKTQSQIAQLAAQRNIPYQVLYEGMKTTWQRNEADRLYKLKQTFLLGSTSETTAIANAQAKLLSSKGTDGFVDPSVYQQQRANSTIGPAEFDNRFSYLLSPIEQKRLGMVKTTTLVGAPSPDQQRMVASWIANNPQDAKSIDQQKLQTDQAYFYWVLNQIQ
jgi:hypothetical protein